MKEKRISELLMALCFAGFLSLILVTTVLLAQIKTAYYENRSLAGIPELTAESVLNGAFFDGFDQALADHCAGRTTMLKAKTAMDLAVNVKLLRCPVVNEVVVKDDLLLPFIEYETVCPSLLSEQAMLLADNVASVRDATESYGGRYFFVAVPCQYVSFQEEYPFYLNNRAEFTEVTKTALLESLAARQVDVVDMGPVLASPEIRDQAASRVDNHYTMYGAYLTYLEIMQAINGTRETPLTVLKEGDFDMTELPNHYMGSRTRKLIDLSSVKEQVSILSPAEPVRFRRYNYGSEVEPSVYAMPATEYDVVDYGIYMGGDIAETLIDTQRDELPSILVYGDSFTNAVECVLYYGFNQMRSLDFRYYTEMSLGEYIETWQPDYVVCIRDYEQLANPTFNGSGAEFQP